MIKVSESAKNKLDALMREEGREPSETYIRVGVNSGGKIFEDQGIRILIDKKSFLYLVGTTLEYSGGLNGKGFSFNNPNASRTCGCGESFAV